MLTTLLAAFLTLASAFPLGWDYRALDDIEDLDCIIPHPLADPRSGVIAPILRWPNARLIFQIDPSFDADVVKYILNTILLLESALQKCIKFTPYDPDNPVRDYVFIKKGVRATGCKSSVGRIGGRQILNLAPRCMNEFDIVHNIIHALGFYHEHNRYDRDDYVQVNWDNMAEAHHYMYRKYTREEVTIFGVPYDHKSILHHGTHNFALEAKVPTMVPIMTGANIGSRDLSELDVKKIHMMYGC